MHLIPSYNSPCTLPLTVHLTFLRAPCLSQCMLRTALRSVPLLHQCTALRSVHRTYCLHSGCSDLRVLQSQGASLTVGAPISRCLPLRCPTKGAWVPYLYFRYIRTFSPHTPPRQSVPNCREAAIYYLYGFSGQGEGAATHLLALASFARRRMPPLSAHPLHAAISYYYYYFYSSPGRRLMNYSSPL